MARWRRRIGTEIGIVSLGSSSALDSRGVWAISSLLEAACLGRARQLRMVRWAELSLPNLIR
jgi:hypothetical protein